MVISHNWDENCGASCGTTWVSCAPTSGCSARCTGCRLLQAEIAEYYGNYKVSNDLLELRNLAMVAELMIRCAISPQGKPRPALHPGLPGPAARRQSTPYTHPTRFSAPGKANAQTA